ncbi:hypothetical protein LIA77_04484 [Sarocladium implicatum]|nr:hypothetical protein LIA77_04484 [Sarocladium implicatum]
MREVAKLTLWSVKMTAFEDSAERWTKACMSLGIKYPMYPSHPESRPVHGLLARRWCIRIQRAVTKR